MRSQQLDGYFTIQQIKDFSDKQIKEGPYLNVIGLIVDFKSAIKTFGADWKCHVEIVDHSLRDTGSGLVVSVFRPLNCMPSTPSVSDVIIVRKAKAQFRDGYVSLWTNKRSTIHILPAKDVPDNASDAVKIKPLWLSSSYDYDSNTKLVSAPSVNESKNAILLSKKKSDIIALASSQGLSSGNFYSSATKKKDKFGLVKDLQSDSFYNLIGEFRRSWTYSDSRVTVYLSDYTENSRLFLYTPTQDILESKDYNDNFSIVTKESENKKLKGPYGKIIIQITLWDSDADFIRNKVRYGNWVLIKNVRIKNGSNDILEGSVHGEEDKVHVQKLIKGNISPEVEERWGAALKRKTAWWNSYEEKLKLERKNPSMKGVQSKRKLIGDIETSPSRNRNQKQRRKEDKAQGEKKSAKMATQLQLNENSKNSLLSQMHQDTHIIQKVQNDYPDKTVVPLSDVLTPSLFPQPGSETLYSPFTNRKYKANVRVVDYFPDLVDDFAIAVSEKERDDLSDDILSDGSDSDLKKEWEWRFSLLLEESSAAKNTKKERVWVVVDDYAARYMLNIEEVATNLREHPNLLLKVQQQLFKLWGNLEEQKLKNLQETALSLHLQNTDVGDQPDLDSDNEKERSICRLKEMKIPAPNQIKHASQLVSPKNEFANVLKRKEVQSKTCFTNKAFTCCIQQYGVKVFEDDPTQANAGYRKRWQRMFGLFGTKIL